MCQLDQNYPNPFNPSTTISFQLKSEVRVSLKIYDVAGRLVTTLVNDKLMNAGIHKEVWNGRDGHGSPVASGVYYYRLQTDAFTATKSMVFMK